MTDEVKRLAVVDCETTGLAQDLDGSDPDRHIPWLLEVGMIVVDLPTFEIVAETNEVLPFDGSIKIAHPKVQAMHTANGLWAEAKAMAEKQKAAGRNANFRFDAEARLCQFLVDAGADGMPLCGANPDFDRRFLERYMPKFAKLFHYRNFDTNTFWLFQSFLTGQDVKREKPATHRALDDCRDAIAVIEKHWDFMAEVTRAVAGE